MDEPKAPRDQATPPRVGEAAKPAAKSSRAEREAKLAAALRANLRRRKAATRPDGC
jgi:hypothetical protein